MHPAHHRPFPSFSGEGENHSFRFGEMARLIESSDWSKSPLGPMARWPQSLKTALKIILHSRFQLAIYWGPELIFFYNDAEREVVGALHPQALGKPAHELLVDMWDEVGPMLHTVLETGEATLSVDRPLLFDRYGFVEQAFFTWSYSPIPDDSGGIGGVLLVTQETTQRVLAQRQLQETAERERALRAQADSQRVLLETVLKQMPAGVVVAKAPSGEVLLTNRQAEEILQRPVGQLREIQEYSAYQLFRPDGTAYKVEEQPLARALLHGEFVIGEELKYLHPDGKLRVLLANAAPVLDETKKIIASVVAFQDISELRLAQEELLRQSKDLIHELAGKLITSQEEERRRIAREIHDDYQQRLAAVAIDLEAMEEHCLIDDHEKILGLWNDVSELAADLHSLSHSLHSSALEKLGLVTGVRAYCEEFSHQQGIQVDFTSENVPSNIPEDAALCLFRISQEALRNIKRHSGANRAEVSLKARDQRVHLSISDRGRGFDSHILSRVGGIGIRSMEERVRLVGGTLEIQSWPLKGTKIEAYVPI